MGRPAITFCVKHQIDRIYHPIRQQYTCCKCKAERENAYGRRCPEVRSASNRRYYAAHPAKYYRSHREQCTAQKRAYRSQATVREHYRYYMTSYRRGLRLSGMSDPCAILRDV